MLLRISFLLLFSFFFTSQLQAQLRALGSWQEHLPYSQGKSVEVTSDRIFCATSGGLFAYMPGDQSLQRFSRLNGLNDFGVKDIAYSEQYGVLIIVYVNTNIDLLYDDGRVLNLNDIKRKNLPGGKSVNKITLDGRFAYLACGFGIVQIDLERREIKDTWYVSAVNTTPDVKVLEMDADWFYAVTANEVLRSSRTNTVLADPGAWEVILSDSGGSGSFNLAVSFNDVLYVNYNQAGRDSLMAWDGSWLSTLPVQLLESQYRRSMRVDNGRLGITDESRFSVYDSGLNREMNVDFGIIPNPDFYDGIKTSGDVVWLADGKRGLVKVSGGNYERYLPQGPNSARVSGMQVVDGALWVLHAPRNRSWRNEYIYEGFSRFADGSWVTYDENSSQAPFILQYTFYDNMGVVVDPSDREHVWVSSSGSGLMELRNGQVIKHFNQNNSPLETQAGNPGACKVHGLSLDRDGNLWIGNGGMPAVLKLLRPDGTWKSFTFPGFINIYAMAGDVVADANGYVWVTVFENSGGKDGILALNTNFTAGNSADDKFGIVEFGTNRVRAMASDKDGTLWVGTEAGIYVVYPPSLVPQQILIRQDNAYQYLLSSETVTAIAVDGANRKWIGTENGGLYLFSSDGQQQLLHFTIENTPLFSNNITALSIDDRTGAVYVGTEKGLMSYQGDAVEAGAEVTGCTDLMVYPNPVRSGYDGPVAIRGVVPNGNIRITDINGGLVFQTRALGAQAVWDGRNLEGLKVGSGVYLVFSSDETGDNTCVTKLMYYR